MAGDMKDYFDDMKLLKKERKEKRLSTNKCKYRGHIIFGASAYISRLEK